MPGSSSTALPTVLTVAVEESTSTTTAITANSTLLSETDVTLETLPLAGEEIQLPKITVPILENPTDASLADASIQKDGPAVKIVQSSPNKALSTLSVSAIGLLAVFIIRRRKAVAR